MSIDEKLAAFAAILQDDQETQFACDYPGPMLQERMIAACKTKVTIGKKYARVDVGTSGKYMVHLETQEIVGIKGYGVPHLGHRYGTLDTIAQWNWGGYTARPASPVQNHQPIA